MHYNFTVCPGICNTNNKPERKNNELPGVIYIGSKGFFCGTWLSKSSSSGIFGWGIKIGGWKIPPLFLSPNQTWTEFIQLLQKNEMYWKLESCSDNVVYGYPLYSWCRTDIFYFNIIVTNFQFVVLINEYSEAMVILEFNVTPLCFYEGSLS